MESLVTNDSILHYYLFTHYCAWFAPGCPWENGYQESFHSQFKVDLGDPNRFKTLGELVYTIYQTIYAYNHTRIHTALKMPPEQFALKAALSYTLINSQYRIGV